jgi:Reverse transcriptase (RNA-dependent DNA polymerase)
MVKQARLQSARNSSVYKLGVRIPRTRKEAIAIDVTNDSKWQEAIQTELDQIHEYSTFHDLGRNTQAPEGYQRIYVHNVFDVKHDLRRKARLAAGGHMTATGKERVYSGAYLEACTKEMVYFVAGPEFGDLAGHTLIIVKALYGLRTSGARFHERLPDTLRDLGYVPCFADPDVWKKDSGTHWEYVCVYVDDLLAMMTKPEEFYEKLTNLGYKLKGVGPPKCHLGGDIYRDQNGTLAWGAKSYIQRLLANFERVFGEKPKEYQTPMVPAMHLELDLSEEIQTSEGIKQ